EYLADRVALINDGEIAAMGTPAELTARHESVRTVSFTANDFDRMWLAHLGNVTVNNNKVTVEGGDLLMANVSQALREHGIDPPELRTHHSSLDDLFVSLTGGSRMEEVNR